MVEEKVEVEETQRPIWRKKKLPSVSTSWYNYNIVLAMEDFKHSVLEVPKQPFDEQTMRNLPTRHYEFCNGYNQVIIDIFVWYFLRFQLHNIMQWTFG